MEKSVAFLKPDDVRWTRFLEATPHDVYHLPEYVALAAKHEGGIPVAFHVEVGGAALLAPLLLRPLPASLDHPPDARDATTPYGYPTPLLTEGADEEALEACLHAFRDAARDERIVSAFFRLHPWLTPKAAVLARNGDYVLHGESVYVDLSLSREQMERDTRRNHRVGVKRLTEAGYRIVMDDWSTLPEFVSVYTMTMKRVSAARSYFLPLDFFQELRLCPGAAFHLATVLDPDGKVAAAGLFSVKNGFVQYLFGGTDDAFLPMAPSKLITCHVRGWAKDLGARFLNIGGGVGGRPDSLFDYKRGFSSTRAPFATWRVVLDEPAYGRLLETWQRKFGAKVEAQSDFFPAYRNIPHDEADRIGAQEGELSLAPCRP